MSQVLEKPILLDETGQDISSKINGVGGKIDSSGAAIVEALDDIKDAIGTASDFIPIMIKVVTPPTKTAYRTGEPLDLSGIVVNLIGSNGVQIDVTSVCTFSPANGTPLTISDTSVTVSYYYAVGDYTFTTTTPVGVKELTSIAVTSPPTKTVYKVGETLDLTGMVVTATFSDYSMIDVTNSCIFNPANGATLTSSDTTITASYTDGATVKTATQAITVKELSSIAITTPPTETNYGVGDTLDLTGIEVTATYSDGSTEEVTSSCTFNPANGTELTVSDTGVTVTFVESGITKTTIQPITVSYPIYGVEWDGTSTRAWTRTDLAADFTDPVPYYSGISATPSSPFDTIQPWAGIVKETRNSNSMVKIPKFWYKLSKNGNAIKVQIANGPQTGFHVSPAHMDRGDGVGERDYIYVARYHCQTGGVRSTSGVKPSRQATRSSMRTSAHATGTNYWQFDYATLFTIQLLYLVEFADWNSQSKIGRGCSQSNSTSSSALVIFNTGYTDSMPYHTGTVMDNPLKYGGEQYRYIEGLWDNVMDYIDGCYNNSDGINVILNPANFSDSTGGILIGSTNVYGFPTAFDISDVSGAFPTLLPTSYQSQSGPTSDRWEFYSEDPCPTFGGMYDRQTDDSGLFCVGRMSANDTVGTVGYRIIELPANS